MGAGVIVWSVFTAAGSFAPVSVIVMSCMYFINTVNTELLVSISNEVNGRNRRS